MTARPDRQDPPPTAGESFLGRWLRLKQTARQAAGSGTEARRDPGVAAAGSERPAPGPTPAPPPAPPPENGLGVAAKTPGSDRPRGPTPQPLAAVTVELPPLESLDAHSDFRPFLAPEVSPDLRRQALRKLFHLPEFNVRDGLTDYWEDYTRFEPLGDLVPHEMQTAMEREARRLAEAAGDAVSDHQATTGADAAQGANARSAPDRAEPERSPGVTQGADTHQPGRSGATGDDSTDLAGVPDLAPRGGSGT